MTANRHRWIRRDEQSWMSFAVAQKRRCKPSSEWRRYKIVNRKEKEFRPDDTMCPSLRRTTIAPAHCCARAREIVRSSCPDRSWSHCIQRQHFFFLSSVAPERIKKWGRGHMSGAKRRKNFLSYPPLFWLYKYNRPISKCMHKNMHINEP